MIWYYQASYSWVDALCVCVTSVYYSRLGFVISTSFSIETNFHFNAITLFHIEVHTYCFTSYRCWKVIAAKTLCIVIYHQCIAYGNWYFTSIIVCDGVTGAIMHCAYQRISISCNDYNPVFTFVVRGGYCSPVSPLPLLPIVIFDESNVVFVRSLLLLLLLMYIIY